MRPVSDPIPMIRVDSPPASFRRDSRDSQGRAEALALGQPPFRPLPVLVSPWQHEDPAPLWGVVREIESTWG